MDQTSETSGTDVRLEQLAEEYRLRRKVTARRAERVLLVLLAMIDPNHAEQAGQLAAEVMEALRE